MTSFKGRPYSFGELRSELIFDALQGAHGKADFIQRVKENFASMAIPWDRSHTQSAEPPKNEGPLPGSWDDLIELVYNPALKDETKKRYEQISDAASERKEQLRDQGMSLSDSRAEANKLIEAFLRGEASRRQKA